MISLKDPMVLNSKFNHTDWLIGQDGHHQKFYLAKNSSCEIIDSFFPEKTFITRSS